MTPSPKDARAIAEEIVKGAIDCDFENAVSRLAQAITDAEERGRQQAINPAPKPETAQSGVKETK
jgi:hypothetical protein